MCSCITVNTIIWRPSIYFFLFVSCDSLRPSQHFSVMAGWVFLGLTSTKQMVKCLAQGHNTVSLVRLKLSILSQALYH